MKTRLIALLVVSSFCSLLWGQNDVLKFRNYGIRQGLSQSSVQQIFQDKKGFLWFTTSDGLNRFDGENFVVYKNNHLNKNSLSDSWVAFILGEDSENTLWLLMQDKSINTFNLRTHEVKRFIPGDTVPGSIPESKFIFFFFEDYLKNVWFSTEKGLFRFNRSSSSFVSCNGEKDTPRDFSQNNVFRIFEDKSGILWFAGKKGLFRYNHKNDSFIQYAVNDSLHGELLSDVILNFIEDNSNKLWMLSKKGFNRYIADKDSFVPFKFPNEIEPVTNINPRVAMCDKKNIFWVGTANGLLNFNSETHQYNIFRSSGQPGSLSNNMITYLHCDDKNKLWIGTQNGLNIWDDTHKVFHSYYHANDAKLNNITSIIPLKNGEVFTLTASEATLGGQLSRLNIHNGTLEKIEHNNCDPQSIPSTNVFRPFTDRNGILWLGSFGNGVIQYSPLRKKFDHVVLNTDKSSRGSNSIWGMDEDSEGNIWLAMYDQGFARYNPVNGSFKSYMPVIKVNGMPVAYTAMDITIDKNNTAWVSTMGAGLIKFDTKTGSYSNYMVSKNNPNSILANFIRMVMIGTDGKLWIETMNNGISILDPSTGKFTSMQRNQNYPDCITNNGLWYIAADKKNNIWISGNGFIDRFNTVDSSFTHFKSKSDNGIIADKALCIFPASDGCVWFGTSGGGISCYDPSKNTFTHWTETDGLANNVVYGILEDDRKNLWLSTNKGLSVFNLESKTFKNYTEADGLQSNEFNFKAFLKSRNNKFYFGGINGFNVFDPNKIRPDSITPESIINGFQIFNKNVAVIEPDMRKRVKTDERNRIIREKGKYYLPYDISYLDNITLNYGEKVFSIEFTSLEFDSPEKTKFRYKMENFDKDWNYIENRNYATYTNLPPGKYIFRVSAANSDGFFNPQDTQLIITIIPPVWRTWWFISIIIIIVLSLIRVYIVMREKRLKFAKIRLELKVKERTHEIEEKNEELKLRNAQISQQKEEIAFQAKQLHDELVSQNKESELALLRSQINPHFLFNTLNNIYSLIYQKSEDAPAAIMKLSEIMRYMLNDATAEKVPLENEISYLKSFIELHLLRIRNNDFVEFNITGDIYGKWLAPMLLVPFVENAFKHGTKNGKSPGIIINLTVSGNKIFFEVTNYYVAGEPVNKDQTGGIGLTNVKRRLQLLHPGKHKLEVNDTGDKFHVQLEFDLT